MNLRLPILQIAGSSILALPVLLFSLSAKAAPDCHEFSPWLLARNALSRLAQSPSETAEALEAATQAESAARVGVSKTIFREYLAGVSFGTRLDDCLAPFDNGGNFLFTLQDIFFSESIVRLRASQSPSIRKFLALLDGKLAAGLAPSFRLTGLQFSPDDPGPWQAGFHRGAGSIYADFRKIPSNEWLLIFTHEMLHGLDDDLAAAMRNYNDPERVARFTALSSTARSLNDLPPAARGDLTGWLEAGLGRGLWAEYRAWVPSLVIYQEGLAEGLWRNVPWVDAVLAQRPASMSFDRFVYLYLDHGSPDPTTGLFAIPLLQSSLAEFRAEFRTQNKLPEPGNLAPLGF